MNFILGPRASRLTLPEEAGQLSRENLDQLNRAIFPSCLRRILAFKFALDTEVLKKYIEIFKFFYQNRYVQEFLR